MTRQQRDTLSLEVNRAFRDGGDYKRRYTLHVIGESLITEWKDLDFKDESKKIAALCSDGALAGY